MMKRRTFLVRGTGWGVAAGVAGPLWLQPASAAAPLIVGQSAALTGPQAGFGIAMRDGILAALHSVNRGGGVDGRRVQLLSLDDQGDKAKTEANTELLTANRQVIGLTGYTTRPC